MNRSAIKNFATWARRTLREQVTARAAQYGISRDRIIEPQVVEGGLLVAGQTLDAEEANQYEQLREYLKDLMPTSRQPQAVDALIDEIAYTWFNRLAALRFMEVKGYIGRVLSSSDPNLVDPDLLREASSIAEMGDLPGLDLLTLDEWRSFANRDPNPDEFLYRRLLIAQCNALAGGIPALFDPRKNYQALFLPANLLNQDSIVQRLVKEVPEEDWQDIEVVGWLYESYIDEKHTEVIKAKTKIATTDIPAATQLFTPHWIVQFMVENSLGRLWLEAHPESRLREYMPYYLESPNSEPLPSPLLVGEGTREGNSGSPLLEGEGMGVRSLQPQDLTVMDPACGSGHILVYAFDLLFEIYKEQGYLERDIPALILTHNLHGLDIDERAAQLASFAVLMKARAVNSRILRKPLAMNITAVRPTHSQTLPLASELNSKDWQPLLEAFKDADNLGSLITPPPFDAEKLKGQLDALEQSDSLFREYVPALRELVLQAELLRSRYWIVVANPPYMGSRNQNSNIKAFVERNYKLYKADLFSAFIIRCLEMCDYQGQLGFMTPFVWMFVKSYLELRKKIINEHTLTTLTQLEYHGFAGADVPVCTFTMKNRHHAGYVGDYIKLTDFRGPENQGLRTLEAVNHPNRKWRYRANADEFAKIPGNPIAYWISEKELNAYSKGELVGNYSEPKKGLDTGENERFLRYWYEVNIATACLKHFTPNNLINSVYKWFPYNKGGDYRKWYGNREYVINWQNNGLEIKSRLGNKSKKPTLRNQDYYFREGFSWTTISSSTFSARYCPSGALFDNGGCTLFSNKKLHFLGALINSKIAKRYLEFLSPTLNFQPGDISRILYKPIDNRIVASKIEEIVIDLIKLARDNWDSFETSWDFQSISLLTPVFQESTIEQSWDNWKSTCITQFHRMQMLETEINRLFIEAYELQEELTPEVPDDQLTIRHADLERDVRSLISYAVGCMMGRYSLDKPGLIHAGQPFDPTLHKTFPADADAIIPITDKAYFEDDIVTRFVEFLRVAYSPETLTENLDFIANALKLKSGESALDRIRRYFVQEFISDHIQTYKKRPIYWLFTSGKKRAFGALVYLHRYDEGILARIRTDYVLELQVKLEGEIARAQQQLDNASSSVAKKAATKRLKELQEQQLELRDYQAKLQTLADARIKLDLDDGVAYNYTRFKGLVYEGADLKMADLEKASQWKLELLKQAGKA